MESSSFNIHSQAVNQRLESIDNCSTWTSCHSDTLLRRLARIVDEIQNVDCISIFRAFLPRLTRLCAAHQMEVFTDSSPPWWSNDTVAVVTGANKGVGYEIVRLLAEQGLTVILTARDSGRGQAALDALKRAGQKSVYFHPLEVQSSESVETLATWLKNKFGGIDILVNNAGIAYAPGKGNVVDHEAAKAIIDTNYYGVKNVTKALLPLMRRSPFARIVNVTSGVGLYAHLSSEKLKQTFSDEDSYSEELIDSLAEKFVEDVKADRYNEEGWEWAKGATTPMYRFQDSPECFLD